MELLQPVKILKFLLFDMRQKKINKKKFQINFKISINKNKFQSFALSLGHGFGYAPGPLQSHDLIGQNVDSCIHAKCSIFFTDI